METTAPGQNWSRTYAYRAPALARPSSMEQLCELVASAKQVGVLGTRHTFNAIADTSGVLVSLDRMPADIEIDSRTATARVSAQLRYGDIVEHIDRHGFGLTNLASLPHISVAGACATASHGSGREHGNLATSVTAMEWVLADGRQVSVRAGDHDFAGTVVHLGALGVVTALTLQLVPSFEVAQTVYEDLTWDVAAEHFDEITSAAYSVSLFTDLRGPRFNAWVKSTDPRPRRGDFFGATPADGPRHPVPDGPGRNSTQQLGVPGPWYARLAHFRLQFTPSSGEEIQSEYFVPRSAARQALAVLAGLAPTLAPVLRVSEIRTIAADDLWLSPAHDQDCVALHFTWRDEPDALAHVLPLLEERLLELSVRPHWGKVFAMPAERFTPTYPRLSDFRDLATRMDPDGVFANDFLRSMVLGQPAHDCAGPTTRPT